MNLTTPTVSTTQKDILSRLLATEDIVVEHSKTAATAMFDVKNRVLVLPIWKDMDNRLYDMFVGHEVGHALFTPCEDASGRSLPQILSEIAGPGGNEQLVMGLMNVVEDARIERKMKIKFPGLRRDFAAGYQDLHKNRDFFELKNEDIDEMSFGDRINLHYKIGDQVEISFTDEERKTLDTIDASESFEDVLDIVQSLYDSHANESLTSDKAGSMECGFDDEQEEGQEDENSVRVGESQTDGSDSTDDEQSDGDASGDDSEDSGASADDDTDDGSSADSTESDETASDGNEPMDSCTGLSTVDAADKNMQQFRDTATYGNKYFRLGEFDAKQWIVPVDITYKSLSCEKENEIKQLLDRKVAKGANLLAKQFEMKKAADEHQRTSIAKTGIIDTVKMCNYKFSDDIFLRNATIASGKNHGLVCFIDWSGSMCGDLSATIEQLYLLATFCKKVNIPFDFYAFSSITPWDNTYAGRRYGEDKEVQLMECPINQPEFDEQHDWDDPLRDRQPSTDLCLYHLVSSDFKARVYTDCMKKLALIAQSYSDGYGCYGRTFDSCEIKFPPHLQLGGTPLDDTIVLARNIVNEFRTKHALQVVHGVFLTDGDSHGGCLRGATHMHEGRKTYNLKDNSYYANTAPLLEWFRATTGAKAIGIFLTNKNKEMLRNGKIAYIDQKQFTKQFKKEKFINCGEARGYTEYFILKSDTTVDQGSFDEVDANISTTKLRTAFSKSQTGCITSRTVLNRIADLIAN